MPRDGRATQLLRAASEGNRGAEEQLIPLVYDELRRLAGNCMRTERPDHILQPTAMVHEAYLRLIAQESNWKGRSHFLQVAGQQMRRILVDHAWKNRAAKRAGDKCRVSFGDVLAIAVEKPARLVSIDVALNRLAAEYPRQARVVELRFFGGYTGDDIAEILAVSSETVKRDWRFERTWLGREVQSL